jgi:hypothetical protein
MVPSNFDGDVILTSVLILRYYMLVDVTGM